MSDREEPTAPLHCHQCESRKMRATGAMQELKVDEGDRLHADVICAACDHRWWSRHPQALELARAQRRMAEYEHDADATPPVEG